MNLQNLSQAELIAMIQGMQKAQTSRLTIKRSEKGAISVYGLGRWPVTLYRSQMERFLEASDDIKAFIETNKATLAEKA